MKEVNIDQLLPISEFFAKHFIFIYFDPIGQSLVFQKKTMKLREVKIIPWGHTASRREELNSVLQAQKPRVVPGLCCCPAHPRALRTRWKQGASSPRPIFLTGKNWEDCHKGNVRCDMWRSFIHGEVPHKCKASSITFHSCAGKYCPTKLLIAHPWIFNLFLEQVAVRCENILETSPGDKVWYLFFF